jgi:hypothetical protein
MTYKYNIKKHKDDTILKNEKGSEIHIESPL